MIPQKKRKNERETPEMQKRMELARKRADCLYTEKRLEIANVQLAQFETFLTAAIERHERHDIETRRLRKLLEVMPRVPKLTCICIVMRLSQHQ